MYRYLYLPRAQLPPSKDFPVFLSRPETFVCVFLFRLVEANHRQNRIRIVCRASPFVHLLPIQLSVKFDLGQCQFALIQTLGDLVIVEAYVDLQVSRAA